MTARTGFPIEMKRGGCTVKIHYTPQKGREGYMLDYRVHGQRKQKRVGRLPEAKRQAQETLTKLVQGDIEALTLGNEERHEYLRAKDALKPTGVPA